MPKHNTQTWKIVNKLLLLRQNSCRKSKSPDNPAAAPEEAGSNFPQYFVVGAITSIKWRSHYRRWAVGLAWPIGLRRTDLRAQSPSFSAKLLTIGHSSIRAPRGRSLPFTNFGQPLVILRHLLDREDVEFLFKRGEPKSLHMSIHTRDSEIMQKDSIAKGCKRSKGPYVPMVDFHGFSVARGSFHHQSL